MPRPVLNCDGTWRTPLWEPEDGRWILSVWDPDTDEPAAIYGRKFSGDFHCMAVHHENLGRKELAGLRKARPDLFQPRPRRAA